MILYFLKVTGEMSSTFRERQLRAKTGKCRRKTAAQTSLDARRLNDRLAKRMR